MFCKNVVKLYGYARVAVTFFEKGLKCLGALSASLNLTLLQHFIEHYDTPSKQ